MVIFLSNLYTSCRGRNFPNRIHFRVKIYKVLACKLKQLPTGHARSSKTRLHIFSEGCEIKYSIESPPLVTIVIPSFNQGAYLECALSSVLAQDLPIEVFVMDGGSSDNSLDIIQRWAPQLAGWRSHPDAGQSAAINEGISQGHAPYVCWLNSDDWYLPGALTTLVEALENHPASPMVYGRAWNYIERNGKSVPIWTREFSEWWLSQLCIISQPATLIRRSAWESVGGLDSNLHMAMDYDLWWRLYKTIGPLQFLDFFVATNREHAATKTSTQRRRHYQEAMAVVRKYHGSVPLKWWLAQPYAVGYRTLIGR